MEGLTVKRLRPDFRERVNRIGDLSWFDGPLLTLFEDAQNGFLYLFDWVDRNSEVNRWLIYRAYPADLLAFMDGRRSLSEIFDSRKDTTLLVADVASVSEWSVYEIEALPESYRPTEDNYFDASDCPDELKIRSHLSGRAYSNRNNELPVTIVGLVNISYKYMGANKLRRNTSETESALLSIDSVTVVSRELNERSLGNQLPRRIAYDNTTRSTKRNTYRYA
jgi:hypothetical protein